MDLPFYMTLGSLSFPLQPQTNKVKGGLKNQMKSKSNVGKQKGIKP